MSRSLAACRAVRDRLSTPTAGPVAGLLALFAVLLVLVATVRLTSDAPAAGVPLAAPAAVAGVDAAPVTSTGTAVRPGATWHDIAVGGTARRYLLAAAPGAGRHPALVVLHGLDQHTDGFLRVTGLEQRALAAGVTVIGPETPDGAWNDGRFGPRGRDDDAYVMAVVDELVATGTVDRDRVTLAGFSNGSGMSFELVARHPGRFRALVAVGGELLSGPAASVPALPVETVLVHGTDDPVSPWEGRARRGTRMPGQIGMPATLAALAAADGAGAPTAERALPSLVPSTAGRIAATVQTWTGPTAAVTLYRLVGAGHVWPVTACPADACRPRADVARLADVSATELAVRAALSRPPVSG